MRIRPYYSSFFCIILPESKAKFKSNAIKMCRRITDKKQDPATERIPGKGIPITANVDFDEVRKQQNHNPVSRLNSDI